MENSYKHAIYTVVSCNWKILSFSLPRAPVITVQKKKYASKASIEGFVYRLLRGFRFSLWWQLNSYKSLIFLKVCVYFQNVIVFDNAKIAFRVLSEDREAKSETRKIADILSRTHDMSDLVEYLVTFTPTSSWEMV